MKKSKKVNNQKCTLSGVSFSARSSNTLTEQTNTGTALWSGGWVTDNFETYYLDKYMVKRYS